MLHGQFSDPINYISSFSFDNTCINFCS